jgi:hypothetical protein
MLPFLLLFLPSLPAAASADPGQNDDVLLLVKNAPADGLVVAPVDLSAAVRWSAAGRMVPRGFRGRLADSDRIVPLQFVPDAEGSGPDRLAGVLVLQLPRGGDAAVILQSQAEAPPESASGVISVATPSCVVTHDPKQMGGLPVLIKFMSTGKTLRVSRWNNRLHHRQLGSFCLCDDPEARVERLADGPLCRVVRVRGRFVHAGKPAPSQPEAVYDWFYFRDRPLVFVRSVLRQKEPFTWHEHHFLELQFPAKVFPHWGGGEPLTEGAFRGTHKSFHSPQWGAIVDGRSALAMFAAGQILFYDPAGSQGSYLQAQGDLAWQPWSETQRSLSAWLWLGTAERPLEVIRAAARQEPEAASVIATTRSVHNQVVAAEKAQAETTGARRQQEWWRAAAARQLEAQGRLEEATQAAAGKQPASWSVLTAGELGLILERQKAGIRLLNLSDVVKDQVLASPRSLPLFALTMRHVATKQEVRLTAEEGWREVQVETPAKQALQLRWRRPIDDRFGNLTVVLQVTAEASASAMRWKLRVDNVGPAWSVWRIVFPQLAAADLGPQGRVFVPASAGEVKEDPWRHPVSFHGTYPSGWTSMPFLAAYQPQQNTGLYCAVHDPLGSTKEIAARSRPMDKTLVLSFDHPAENMGEPGNGFALSGEAVWQLLRGDWFDAALIYRTWVRREARWYPRLGTEGRGDTPSWMRELPAWALGGGGPKDCVGAVKAFARYLDVPVGFHWYNWHQIPFDNDYPHYFPAKEGFAQGVRELQASGVEVMPYINGRLWDTRDRGLEDWEFTRVARPAVTKNEKGEPYTESYGSKETDGSRVRLGVMCPATPLWQNRLREIVLRLFQECGVKGVYIDQVAAASPVLCFDRSHGHPLGGGHWWTEHGYWPLLAAIRQQKPADRMLTTECNGEPFIHSFDGYLTWHWQYDGQVAAFPAVYGGAIQMFGRAYGGGPTRDLALRMRAGQQLVFGEQIGWLSPDVIKEKENAAFLRQVVRLRWQLRRYFHAGEMARPPQLGGQVPTVRADWQWGGTRWVTTAAVLTGAWFIPAEKRLVLLAVNVSDEAVTTKLRYDTAPHGLAGRQVRLMELKPEGPGTPSVVPAQLELPLTLPARTARAWEVTPP